CFRILSDRSNLLSYLNRWPFKLSGLVNAQLAQVVSLDNGKQPCFVWVGRVKRLQFQIDGTVLIDLKLAKDSHSLSVF
ncbi:MAG: hypothetical protein KDE51_27825, partial [Anaerolineales bacterium]|nr:hypothetical protein [Anaerolineales bacterium]